MVWKNKYYLDNLGQIYIFRVGRVPINIITGLFEEIGRLILKFIAQNSLKKVWECYLLSKLTLKLQ